MVTACNLNSTFNLKNIKLYNLDLYWSRNSSEIKLFQKDLLSSISFQIMLEYNSEISSNKLKKSDFVYGTTPTKEHPWAIEVLNIDGITPLIFNPVVINKIKFQAANLLFPGNYTILTDNALKVKITTINNNVSTKSATVNGYLNQFLYTNANLNQGHDLNTNDPSGFVTTLGSQTVFDIHSYISQTRHDATGLSLAHEIETISKANDATMSKQIFTAFNNQLKKETKTLNDLGVLKVIDADNTVLNLAGITFEIYSKTNNQMTLIRHNDPLSAAAGAQLFAKVFLPSGSFYGYVAKPGACLYLYLGTTT